MGTFVEKAYEFTHVKSSARGQTHSTIVIVLKKDSLHVYYP